MVTPNHKHHNQSHTSKASIAILGGPQTSLSPLDVDPIGVGDPELELLSRESI